MSDSLIIKGRLLREVMKLEHEGKPLKDCKPKIQKNFLNAVKYIRLIQYSRKKDKETLTRDRQFANISARKFEKDLGSSWKSYVKKALTESNIVDFNEKCANFPETSFSQSYKINKMYLGEDCWGLDLDLEVPYSCKLKRRRKKKKEELLAPEKFDWKKHMARFTIDLGKCFADFEKVARKRKWGNAAKAAQHTKLLKFDSNNYVHWGKTGRQYNKVNGLPKEFRKHILFDLRPVKEMDLFACAMCQLAVFMEGEELESWKHSVKFKLVRRVIINTTKLSNEKAVKKAFNIWLGGGKSPEIDKFFKKFYRNFYRWRESLEDKGDLARLTQKTESQVVNSRYFRHVSASLHDGLLCAEEDAERIRLLLEQEMSKSVGAEMTVTYKEVA